MSPEESRLLQALFERVNTAAAAPRDRDAELFVARAVEAQPSAPYYLAQAVILQERGLEAADARIRALEETVRRLEAAPNASPQGQQGDGGFLGSLFGSAGKAVPAERHEAPAGGDPWAQTVERDAARQGQLYDDYSRNAPQPPSGTTGGPWSHAATSVPSVGGGFLQGALTTAAGVAGGMLLADSLRGLFGSHMSSLGLGAPFGAATAPVEETVINNYYGDANPPMEDRSGDIQQADLQDDNGKDDDDSGSDFGGGDDGSMNV